MLNSRLIIFTILTFFIVSSLQVGKTFAYTSTSIDSSDSSASIIIVSDSLNKTAIASDSLDIKKTSDDSATVNKTAPVDSILHKPLDKHGAFCLLSADPYKKIEKQDLLFMDYSEFSDILAEKIPAYPLNLGYFGQYNHFSIFGAMPSDISFRFNGRPLDDMLYQTVNLSELEPEAYENIEVFTGSDAVIFSDNASGAFINLQEIRYDTKYPYTKLWYSQAGYDFLAADIIFSQNFTKDMNFNFGIRRQTGKGMFENNTLDGWNVRGGIRWNPTDLLSISLVENFTNHCTGLNGGINYDKSDDLYDPIVAEVYYTKLNDRVWSHDITLSGSLLMGEDSSSALSGSAYFSYNNWEKYRSEDIRLGDYDSIGSINFLSRDYGISLKYEQNFLDFFTLRVGGDINNNFLEGSLYSDEADAVKLGVFAHGTMNLTHNLKISGGMRISQFNGKTLISAGEKAVVKISDFILTADFSRSQRMPSAAEGFDLKEEEHLLALTEIKWYKDLTNISIAVFARNINSPIINELIFNEADLPINTISNNGTSKQIFGANTEINTVFFKNINLSLFAQVYKSNTDEKEDKRFPLLYAGGTCFYEMKFGASILRLGTTIYVISGKKGMQFVPQKRVYVDYQYQSNFNFNGVEVFARAKLGDAYVKVAYQNALDRGYFFVPIYPQIDANFRLSFSWAFMN